MSARATANAHRHCRTAKEDKTPLVVFLQCSAQTLLVIGAGILWLFVGRGNNAADSNSNSNLNGNVNVNINSNLGISNAFDFGNTKTSESNTNTNVKTPTPTPTPRPTVTPTPDDTPDEDPSPTRCERPHRQTPAPYAGADNQPAGNRRRQRHGPRRIQDRAPFDAWRNNGWPGRSSYRVYRGSRELTSRRLAA